MPRLTIEFPDQVNDILKDLAQKDGTTKVEILRRSLALYNYAHREAINKGMKLSVTDHEDKVVKDIAFAAR